MRAWLDGAGFRRAPVLLAGVLALLGLGMMLGQVHKARSVRAHGELLIVPVRGYDPIDLLRGHYLALDTDWDLATPGDISTEFYRKRVWVTLEGELPHLVPGIASLDKPAQGRYFQGL